MTENADIRGMAWDHPRALLPLTAISANWSQRTGKTVQWDARPLKDFEDQPLEELADRYDLVLIDHPFVETAALSGLVEPVEDWTTADYLEDQSVNSVGPSFPSYNWNGRHWALPIDAATQVGAARPDLFDIEADWPEDWDAVAALAGRFDAGRKVAIPLNPNHAYCAFLSVAVAMAGGGFWPAGERFDAPVGTASLEFLKSLLPLLHPVSIESDPIAVSELMSRTDEIAFVPLMFGYSNYARQGFRPRRLAFGEAPRGLSGRIGSVLGGVGIALSARSMDREAAADLARLLVAPEVQAGRYVRSGGQPGHANAWNSPEADAMLNGFFSRTRRTMADAFLRPRTRGHRPFQEDAGMIVSAYLRDPAAGAAGTIGELTQLYDRLLEGWESDQIGHKENE